MEFVTKYRKLTPRRAPLVGLPPPLARRCAFVGRRRRGGVESFDTVMNATPTTLSNAPGRWRRWTARGVYVVVHALTAVLMFVSADLAQGQISYRGAGTVATFSSGNVTPGLPSGWQPDDIHIAVIELWGSSNVTMPAGWNSIGQGNHTCGGNNTCHAAVFWRRAVAGDTAPLVTQSVGGSIMARIIGFANVDTATALDVTPSFAPTAGGAEGLTVVAPAISTVTADTMLVFTASISDDGQPTGNMPSGSSPWAKAFWDQQGYSAGGGSSFDPSIAAFYGLRSAVGNQPALTLTIVNAGSHGAQIALRPLIVNKIVARTPAESVAGAIGALTLTINKPAGTVASDVMIASIAYRLANNSPADPRDIAVAPPAGWTLVRRMDNYLNATESGLAVYWKADGGSEPANYTWTFSCINVSGLNTCVNLGGPNRAVGGIVSFSGVDPTNPIAGIENGAPSGNTATQATPSITTLVPNTMLVTSHSIANPNNWASSPPSGMAQAYQVKTATASGSEGVLMMQVSTAIQAVEGATGTKSATDLLNFDTGADYGNAHILALRPLIKFYFHDAATPNVGTLPGATTLSTSFVHSFSTGAGTNRDMNQTIGTAQVSAALTTLAQTSPINGWFRRFLSRPLAAQTLPTGVWTIQGGASESDANSNMLPWGAVIKVWRPSTGAVVATLLDNPQLGTTEAGTTETNISSATSSISGVAVLDGDVLVVELWVKNSQSSATAYTNTIFYDGTTEGSTTSNAAYLKAPGNIAFYRSTHQSAYRWFDNTNTTDVGTALAAQNTAATVGTNGSTFRLRMLLHIADIDLASSGQAYKVQFVGKGSGTCAAPTGGTPAAYTDVTAATVIAYNDNAAPADGAALTSNASDPTHSGHTLRNQDYEELNNFTNSESAINAGEDGKWDFALKNNGAPNGITYCFRAVKSTGTALDFHYFYPEFTTAVGATTPGSFNGFETSTAALAITGQVYTKRAATNFSLDAVANLTSAQLATFTGTVHVDLVTGAAGGQNCPGTPVGVSGTALAVNLTSGRGTTANFNIASAYPDVRVRVRYPNTASPTVTSCSTDNFSIRPSVFTVTSTNATNNAASGTPTIKTGASFNLTAASVVGYNGTPTLDNTKVVGTPTAGTIAGSFGAAPAGTGTATGASFTYSQVGNLGLNTDAVRDTAFTSVDQAAGDCVASSTSNTLSGGKYGCWVGSTAVAQTTGASGFGRFIPDNFNVTLTTTPVFGAVCGTFTYVGTKFTYPTAVMTVTARNGASLGNATTTNYTGTYMKLTNAGLTPATQLLRYPRFDALGGGTTPALDTAGLPAPAGDPAISITNGVGTLTFGSGTGLAFTRSTTTPNAPFNADIALAINVIDTDLVAYAGNPASFGAASSGGGISFSSGNAMRFGRLVIRNANGSQLVPLQVQVEAQYWSGAPTNAFITNTMDNCTTIASGNNAMGPYTSNLSSCETALSGGGTLGMGRKTLQLAAPGAANNGSVTLTVNLGASASGNTCTAVGGGPGPATTAANLPHLLGNWTGANYDQNPTARATFGVSRGAEEVIFVRENF
ncbi:MAG: DUF6701 domain-containing protein [Burkholderiales bacterium]